MLLVLSCPANKTSHQLELHPDTLGNNMPLIAYVLGNMKRSPSQTCCTGHCFHFLQNPSLQQQITTDGRDKQLTSSSK
jgi:hypothetical protein